MLLQAYVVCSGTEPNSRVPEEEVVDEDGLVLRAPTHKMPLPNGLEKKKTAYPL
jgi:hypothetical protein